MLDLLECQMSARINSCLGIGRLLNGEVTLFSVGRFMLASVPNVVSRNKLWHVLIVIFKQRLSSYLLKLTKC